MTPEVGYIYIATNPYLIPGCLKIGLTTGPVPSRMRTLSMTSIPGQYRALHSWLVSDVTRAERLIHERFGSQRIDVQREFFMLPDVSSAAETITDILVSNKLTTHQPPPTRPREYKPPSNYIQVMRTLPDVFTLKHVMELFSIDAFEADHICRLPSLQFLIERVGRGYPASPENTLFISGYDPYGTRLLAAELKLLDQPSLFYGKESLGVWLNHEYSSPKLFFDIAIPTPPTISLSRHRYHTIDRKRFDQMWEHSRPMKPATELLRRATPETALVQMIDEGFFLASSNNPPLRKLLNPKAIERLPIVELCFAAADALEIQHDIVRKCLSTVPFFRKQLRQAASLDSVSDLPSP